MPPDATQPVTEAARRVLRDHIDTFDKLEALALLWRHRDAAWSAITAGEQLRLPGPIVAVALDALCHAGLVAAEKTGGVTYQYRPRDELADGAEQLCQRYEEDRAGVLAVLATLAMERIKSSAARAFADAFRIRPDNDKGKK